MWPEDWCYWLKREVGKFMGLQGGDASVRDEGFWGGDGVSRALSSWSGLGGDEAALSWPLL